MKKILLLLIFLCTISFSNTIGGFGDLKWGASREEAKKYLMETYKLKEYAVYEFDDYTQVNFENIKFLESKAIVAIKVNYIFFDGTKLSKKAIDSKRKEILSMHQKGSSSDDLVAQFTMDHNVKPGGNFGWRDELDVESTFREAVKKHKKGDVFTVDVPELNWYYVVFKLYDDIEKVALFYIKVRQF